MDKYIVEKYFSGKHSFDIRCFDVIDSTNTALKAEGAKGAKEGTVIIADSQTMGRGRLGRRFESPTGTGIYMSILLRPKFNPEEALKITTGAAVAIATAIEDVSGEDTKIKWVNDIYMRERKVCGILAESSLNFETKSFEYCVLGIGINVKAPEGGFPEEIKDIAGAVFEEYIPEDAREKIVAKVLDNFFNFYENMPSDDYIDDYRRRSLLTGREVTYINNLTGLEESGIAVDVDKDCHLLVKLTDGSIKAFSTGEVNLKKTFLKR